MIAEVAAVGELFAELDCLDGAVAVVGRRAGDNLDPVVAEGFRRHGPSLLADLDALDFLLGHGRQLGIDAEEERTLRGAGLLHHLSRAGVPSGIWLHRHRLHRRGLRIHAAFRKDGRLPRGAQAGLYPQPLA